MILGLFLSITLVVLHQISSPAAAKTYDIVEYGAISGSNTKDSKGALSDAWSDACDEESSSDDDSPTVLVPPGKFTLSSIVFKGSCKSHVTFQINGTLVAQPGLGLDLEFWVLFDDVDRVTIRGGTLCGDDYHFDGNGPDLWDCKKQSDNCPIGRRTLGIMHSKSVSISKLKFLNSQLFHIAVDESESVTIRGVKIKAPEDSPNTDGIHIEKSCNVRVYNAKIATGDDCVSIGPGAKNVLISHVQGGPGHGISIGSLGRSKDEDGVVNVTVSHSKLTETQNGVRMKTFPTLETTSFARHIVFEHIKMKNVSNPILIDQQYCPHDNCLNSDEGSSSGAKLSEITYQDITGTSWSQVVMRLSCSNSTPCSEIKMTNINLKYVKDDDEPAQTICSNAVRTSIDNVEPKISC